MDEPDSIVPPRWTITTKPRRSQEDLEARCQVYSTEWQALQKRLLPALLKMHRGGRSQIRPRGNTRRGLQRSHEGKVTGQEDYEDGLLLAHDATRCSRVCEEVWQLSEIWERSESSRRKDDNHFLALVVRTMGDRHYGSPCHKERDRRNSCSSQFTTSQSGWKQKLLQQSQKQRYKILYGKTLFVGSGFQGRSFQTTVVSSIARHSDHFART